MVNTFGWHLTVAVKACKLLEAVVQWWPRDCYRSFISWMIKKGRRKDRLDGGACIYDINTAYDTEWCDNGGGGGKRGELYDESHEKNETFPSNHQIDLPHSANDEQSFRFSSILLFSFFSQRCPLSSINFLSFPLSFKVSSSIDSWFSLQFSVFKKKISLFHTFCSQFWSFSVLQISIFFSPTISSLLLPLNSFLKIPCSSQMCRGLIFFKVYRNFSSRRISHSEIYE